MNLKRFSLLLIIFLIIFLFFLSTSCSAILIEEEYDYLYNYVIMEDTSHIDSYIESVRNDNRVLSGDYYYFIYSGCNWDDPMTVYYSYFLKKDISDFVIFDFNGYSVWQTSCDVITFFYCKGDDVYKMFDTGGYLDSTSKTYTFKSFATNYPR